MGLSISLTLNCSFYSCAFRQKGALAMRTTTARKTSPKINAGQIVTNFDCPILLAFYIAGKVRYWWIGVRDVKLNTEN